MLRRLARSQTTAEPQDRGSSALRKEAKANQGRSPRRQPPENLLIVAGPGLENAWGPSLYGGRTGEGRLFTNCWTPPAGPVASCGILLTGRLPAGEDAWEDFDRVDAHHLGHYLHAHHRTAVIEGPKRGGASTGRASSLFGSGFDAVVAAGAPGSPRDALALAERAIREANAAGAGTWLVFVYLSARDEHRPGLADLARTAARHRATLVLYQPAAGSAPGPHRTPLYLEFPHPTALLDPARVPRPRFCSPLDLLSTLLGETGPELTSRADLGSSWRGVPLRPDLLAETLGEHTAASTGDETADRLLRLVGSIPGPIGSDHFEPMSIVVAVNDTALLRHNLLRQPLDHHAEHQWLIVDNTAGRYSSISSLYAEACDEAKHDLLLFCHQDVFFPAGWETRFLSALHALERADPMWGVVGSVGVLGALPGAPQWPRRRFRHNRGHWADPYGYRYAGPLPQPVQSLDEMWLGTRKRFGIRFDPSLPGFHCYGIDLSLTALTMGRPTYALDAFVWHRHRDHTGSVVVDPGGSGHMRRPPTPAFREAYTPSYHYVGEKWRHLRPFASTSAEWPADDARPETRQLQGSPLSEQRSDC